MAKKKSPPGLDVKIDPRVQLEKLGIKALVIGGVRVPLSEATDQQCSDGMDAMRAQVIVDHTNFKKLVGIDVETADGS